MSKKIVNVSEVLSLCFVNCFVEEGFGCFSSMSGASIVSYIRGEDVLLGCDLPLSGESPYDIIERRVDIFGGFELDMICDIIEENYEPSFFDEYKYIGVLKRKG